MMSGPTRQSWEKKSGEKKSRGKKAFAAGQLAERAAAALLTFKGYRVLAQRYRTPVGEIDLVVEKGGVLVFVEVKWRPTSLSAAEAITPHQRQRVIRAAEWYLARSGDVGRACRFDALLVVPWRFPVHIRDAWQAVA